MERAEVHLNQAQQRAWAAIEKQRLPLQAKRLETPAAVQAALTARSKAWRYPQLARGELIDHKRYAGQGRPTATSPLKAIAWQRHAQVRPAQEVIEAPKQPSACFGIGPPMQARHVSDAEVLQAHKAQSGVEGGGRFLQDPLFFVSSLFVKNPSRIPGLLLVMTLALLVYALTQRRLRQQ
jgi:hypothetical protein